MLKQRIVTAIIGIPLFLAALYAGGLWWTAILIGGAVIGARESARLLQFRGRSVSLTAALGAMGLILIAYYISVTYHRAAYLPTFWMLIPIGMSLTLMYRYTGHQPKPTVGFIAASLYPGIFLVHFLWLRQISFHLFLLATLITWITDTSAYFVGRRWGKTKLSPRISPNKTVEGAIGGLLGGGGIAILWAIFGGQSIAIYGIVALLASGLAQLGDLYESALKRRSGVKDSGTWLPGHGGFLDRFDSLFFSTTLIYFLFPLLQ